MPGRAEKKANRQPKTDKEIVRAARKIIREWHLARGALHNIAVLDAEFLSIKSAIRLPYSDSELSEKAHKMLSRMPGDYEALDRLETLVGMAPKVNIHPRSKKDRWDSQPVFERQFDRWAVRNRVPKSPSSG